MKHESTMKKYVEIRSQYFFANINAKKEAIFNVDDDISLVTIMKETKSSALLIKIEEESKRHFLDSKGITCKNLLMNP